MFDFDIIKQLVFSAIRTFSGPLVVWLGIHGGLSQSDALNLLIMGGTVVLTLIWSAANKFKANAKIDTALKLPAGSSPVALKAAMQDPGASV